MGADDLLPNLELWTALPSSRFCELHHRTIAQPIDRVWDAALAVTARELRSIGPLFALRGLPSYVRGRKPPTLSPGQSLIDSFSDAGFVVLRQDDAPVEGRAVTLLGAAGKFWSPAHNAPLAFGSPQEFLDFDEPGYAKTVARLEAITDGSQTRIETETLVAGTDGAANRKFAPYWMIIRGPSGLIRRSWLAAIDRRANRS